MDTQSQQPSTLKYVSLFSGIEAASVAWEPLGFTPLAFAEVEPFPSAVLAERFPHIPNLGDVTAIDWRPYRGVADIVVGGSPCQSFSIAGRREGLKGASGLMFEYIRAVREILPRFFVWENVPGALSVERGAAFGQLIREMDELGYGLAWRILDAQFVRVPNGKGNGFTGPVAQRRRRLFLVGSLDSQRAADILFEPDSLRGDHPSSRKKREELTRTAGYRPYSPSGATIAGNIIGRGDRNGGHQVGINEEDVSFTLTSADHHAVCSAGALNPWDSQTTRVYHDKGIAPSLCATPSGGFKDGVVLGREEADVVCLGDDNAKASCDRNLSGALKVGGSAPIVNVQAPAYCQNQYRGNLIDCDNPSINIDSFKKEDALSEMQASSSFLYHGSSHARGIGYEVEQSPTITAEDKPPAVAFAQNSRDEVRLISGDGSIAGALTAERFVKQQTYVADPQGYQTQYGDELAGTLTARNDSSPCADRGQNIVCRASHQAHSKMQTSVLCRASGMANAETLVDCAPCQVARQYKDPSMVCLNMAHASRTETPACTLKIRSGCEGGGKGALVQQELSATLATHQDQTLFLPEGQEYVVRRLMPIECERLQGFPDDWTRIAWRNKPADACPDTPRFKALGNSMAVPVMRWIGWRIAQNS